MVLVYREGNPPARGNGKSIQSGDYTVELSVGQKINITFKYVDPGNKPLDLYYLMDLSATMRDSKVELHAV